jgi:hypothetical protein
MPTLAHCSPPPGDAMIRSFTLAAAFLLAGSLLWSTPGNAESRPGGADPALVLMKRSGMYEQLGSLAPAIEQQIQTEYPGMPLATRATLAKAMREAYAAEPMREAARAVLSRSLDANHLRGVDAWLGSPQGQRITRLEEEASTPEGTRKMQAYAASLQMQPPSVDRISLMQDLDRVTGSTELATEIAIETAGAVARGMSAMNTGAASAAEIHAAIEAQRPAIRAAMEQSTLVSLLFTYQSLSAQQVGAYIAFMKSPAGRWYHQVMVDATAAALDQANVRLEALLAGAPRGSRPAAIAR